MNKYGVGRRDFLKSVTAPGCSWSPCLVRRQCICPGRGGAATAVRDDPTAKFPIKVSEVEFRRNQAGRMLMARIYQPEGAGPFPTVLDLHGGAWNGKDRHAEEPMDRALAASGVLVVAIDMTLAPEAPYPACVQDANYGVRWLKSKAAVVERRPLEDRHLRQLQRRARGRAPEHAPARQRYNAIPAAGSAELDATVAYVAMRSPISDPFARFKNAEKMKRETMIKNHTMFFKPWETIFEINPQQILERQRDGLARAAPDHAGRARRQRAAGHAGEIRGDVQGRGRRVRLHLFEGCRARVGSEAGPQTDRAREMVKAFIARNLST